MNRTVKEEVLVKALSDMESIAKGGRGEMPSTTAKANGGLSDEGDKQELAVKGNDEDDFDDDEDMGKGGKTLSQWAKEEMEEEKHKKAKKAVDYDDDEDESGDDDDEDEGMSKCVGSKMAKKSSMADLIKSDPNAGAVVDVSPFIETLVDTISESEMELRKAVIDMESTNNERFGSIRKAMSAMGNLVLEINGKMDQILETPTSERRSVLSKSEINERFDAATPDFSKSDVLDAMFELTKSGSVSSLDVTRYETTNTMEPHVASAVQDHLMKKSA